MIIFIVLILSITACTITGRITEEDTIKIGAALPLTGAISLHGQYTRQGMELALKEINSRGGIHGKQLEIIYEDTQSQSSEAVLVLKRMIELHNVPVVIVGASSPETTAQAPIAEENKVPIIACGSAAKVVSAPAISPK